jgi:hypothetical protein
MTVEEAPGLPADWLNGWLAAVGITVLVPTARLAWSDHVVPHAWFEVPRSVTLAGEILAGLSDPTGLDQFAIARKHQASAIDFERRVSLDAFRDRARLARSERDGTLEMSVTDLAISRDGQLEHAPLDPPAPQGRTLHQRFASCVSELQSASSETSIRATLAGRGKRVAINGLGFDSRRFAGGVQPQAKSHVDPVIECLCFHALRLFPVRASGRFALQRGWTKPGSVGRFVWPVWRDALDRWAIDALLDRVQSAGSDDIGRCRRVGVHGFFASVYRKPLGSSDVNRAYAGERLW